METKLIENLSIRQIEAIETTLIEEIEITRMKRLSSEFSKFGGVRED